MEASSTRVRELSPIPNSGRINLRTICDTANGDDDCTDTSAPFCVSNECKNEKPCATQGDCESPIANYVCVEETQKCTKAQLIRTYITKENSKILIDDRLQGMQETIKGLKSGAGSIHDFKKDQRLSFQKCFLPNLTFLFCRQEWVRERWNKHSHVKWIIDMSQKLTKDTLDFLKTHFSIRTWKEIFAANEAEARYRDRVKTFAKRERNRVEKLLEKANDFIDKRRADLRTGTLILSNTDEAKYTCYLTYVQRIVLAIDEDIRTAEEELRKEFDGFEVDCPVAAGVSNGITEGLVDVSFNSLEKIKEAVDDCKKKMNAYLDKVHAKYKGIHDARNPQLDKCEAKIRSFPPPSQGASIPNDCKNPVDNSDKCALLVRQSTTDDRWDDNDNLFDILIRNNEDLITALVGQFPADGTQNVLTGLQVRINFSVSM